MNCWLCWRRTNEMLKYTSRLRKYTLISTSVRLYTVNTNTTNQNVPLYNRFFVSQSATLGFVITTMFQYSVYRLPYALWHAYAVRLIITRSLLFSLPYLTTHSILHRHLLLHALGLNYTCSCALLQNPKHRTSNYKWVHVHKWTQLSMAVARAAIHS